MDAQKRRQGIAARLEQEKSPLSATALAREFSVSRQVIVGDIALLRASGLDVSATPRGYVLPGRPVGGLTFTVACSHGEQDMERELNAVVDQGGTVLDVIVEHPVYGQITAPLQLNSRYEVGEFIRRVREEDAPPLSQLTAGVHLHTISCPDEASFARVREELGRMGLLLRD